MKKNRYSFLSKPLHVSADFLAIFFSVYSITFNQEFLNSSFLGFVLVFWLLASLFVGYYRIDRYSSFLTVVRKSFKISVVFSLGFFAYFGLFKEGVVVHNQFNVLFLILISTFLVKTVIYIFFKNYRKKGKNYRNAVILGNNQSTQRIINFFNDRKSLGIKYKGYFSNIDIDDSLGKFEDCFDYIKENEIDEVYCSIQEFSKEEIKTITKFSNANNIDLKLIPDFEQLYSKRRSVQYFDDALMVLSVGKLPFQYIENFIVKRIFDVAFSLFVCIFILSWLYPIIWILIKLESKGPAIFKQNREGLYGEEFVCYKFRSMRPNAQADKVHASKNDPRITKIGAFLRKSSMDELPQFINVLKGDMSVVGPRPHVEALSLEYQQEVEVDNYIRRFAMKPGITGLAQVSGFRGEVKERADIKNRVRMDVFYIENWSFLLDIKIILMTVFNVIKGEEKAY